MRDTLDAGSHAPVPRRSPPPGNVPTACAHASRPAPTHGSPRPRCGPVPPFLHGPTRPRPRIAKLLPRNGFGTSRSPVATTGATAGTAAFRDDRAHGNCCVGTQERPVSGRLQARAARLVRHAGQKGYFPGPTRARGPTRLVPAAAPVHPRQEKRSRAAVCQPSTRADAPRPPRRNLCSFREIAGSDEGSRCFIPPVVGKFRG